MIATLDESPALKGDYALEVRVSHLDGFEVGDLVVVRATGVAEPGQVVVARDAAGKFGLRRMPVDEGWSVTGLVVGLVREIG